MGITTPKEKEVLTDPKNVLIIKIKLHLAFAFNRPDYCKPA